MSASLLFSTTTRWDSRLIRLFTWSAFSHVDLIDGSHVIGAMPGEGVVRVPMAERIQKSSSVLVVDTHVPGSRIASLVRGQIGKPYDWSAVFLNTSHRDWVAPDAWFCSELIAWAFRSAGHPLIHHGLDLDRITPQMLLIATTR